MSWLFSQALVAAYSGDTCSDGEPFAQWNVMPTPQGFWRNDKMMEFSRLSRFGPTCRRLTDGNGAVVLTSFLAAFPARTSAPPEGVPVSQASAPDSGWKWPGSLAKYDPDSCTWKTRQCSLLEDSVEYSETWPRWGMTRDGELLPLPMSARLTSASGSGLWPTPTVHGNHNQPGMSKNAGWDLSSAVKLWPTPLATDGSHGGPNQRGSGGELRLSSAVHKFATSQARDHRSGQAKRWHDARKTRNLNDQIAAMHFPTPTATMHKGWSENHNRAETDDRLDYTIEREANNTGNPGQLNPTWVEWLMGWPLGWTDLKPSAMDKFRAWRQQHGGCSVASVGERVFNLSVEDDAQAVCDLLNQLDARANHDDGDPEELDFDDEAERVT